MKRLLAAATPADAEGIAALGEVADAVRASTLALQNTPATVPLYTALVATVVGLRDAQPETSQPSISAAQAEAERVAAEEEAAEAARLAEQEAAREQRNDLRLNALKPSGWPPNRPRPSALLRKKPRRRRIRAPCGRGSAAPGGRATCRRGSREAGSGTHCPGARRS